MNAKHTPGPWTLLGTKSAAVRSGDTLIASVATGSKSPDACLIAAAPELLEALINCSRRFDKYDEQDAPELVANVRSAIAKATGGAE